MDMYVGSQIRWRDSLLHPPDFLEIKNLGLRVVGVKMLKTGAIEAIKEYGDIDIFTSNFRPVKATLSGIPDHVFMKHVVCAKTNKVLGLHVQGFAIVIKAGLTKADFDATVGIHPITAEEFVTMRNPTRQLRTSQPQPIFASVESSVACFVPLPHYLEKNSYGFPLSYCKLHEVVGD